MAKGVPLDIAELQHCLNVYTEQGSNGLQAARVLGLSDSGVHKRVAMARKAGLVPQGPGSDLVATLRAELGNTKSRLRSLEAAALTDAYVKQAIFGLRDGPIAPPAWLVTGKATSALTGVPMFFLSDIHHGEVVRPEEIGGVNRFDLATSHARLRAYIREGVELLTKHLASPKFGGAVLMLGGDMVSGDIHEELSNTNALEPLPAVLDLAGTLVWAIRSLADQFGRVHVPCVTGNHGRMSRRPRAKRRNHTNFDWLLYQVLALQFQSDKRVTFQIPDGPDARFSVYQTRYLLTHGDQFRGGDGFAGAVVPIARGDKKKRAKQSRVHQDYDVQCMGHWHSYIHTEDWVVNGSVKGYDEWANSMNFDPQPPIQALWITHPSYGMTFRMPVYLERRPAAGAQQWVRAA